MAEADQQKNLAFYVRNIRQGESACWEKDDLLDVLYWFRQILGVAMGLLWGFAAITGFIGLASAVLLGCLVVVAVYKSILGIDEEDYGGHSDLVQEGLPGWMGSFLLCWTLSYTAFHT